MALFIRREYHPSLFSVAISWQKFLASLVEKFGG